MRRARRAGEPRARHTRFWRVDPKPSDRVADGGEEQLGLLQSVLGSQQRRHRPGALQHAAARRRLRLHGRGTRPPTCGLFQRVRGPKIEAGAESSAGTDGALKGDAPSMPSPPRWPRARRQALSASRHHRPTTASSSTPPARPGAPKGAVHAKR